MIRGRGECTGCTRKFPLTYKGTIPGHTTRDDRRRPARQRCGGSDREPKVAAVATR